jgi:hypothetical protein
VLTLHRFEDRAPAPALKGARQHPFDRRFIAGTTQFDAIGQGFLGADRRVVRTRPLRGLVF